jgi:hypothetical protein
MDRQMSSPIDMIAQQIHQYFKFVETHALGQPPAV